MNLISLKMSSIAPLIPYCTWVKIFELSDTPFKTVKNKVRLGHKLRCSNLLVIECPYGETNLGKLEVQSIFSILVRDVFRTRSNIYNEAKRH